MCNPESHITGGYSILAQLLYCLILFEK